MIHCSFWHGENFRCGEFVVIEENVVVGDNVTLDNFVTLQQGCRIENNVKIGDYCRIGNCIIRDRANIRARTTIADGYEIGRNAFIGGSCILGRSHTTVRHKPGENLISKIGDNVELGIHVAVLAGCDIAPGIKVGAGAVVTKPLSEIGIYIGCPACKFREVG